MNDRERQVASKLTGYLDSANAELRPGLAYRLQKARADALARLAEPERASALQPAWAAAGGGNVGGGSRPFYQQARFWLLVALLGATFFGTFGAEQWRAYQQAKELAELDSQILTSDLPIDAYLDRGFQNWLRAADND